MSARPGTRGSNRAEAARPRPTCSTASRRALMLTDVEREHLFLIGLGRPPEVRYQAAEGVTPRLQRVLDSLELSPAIVKTSTWDVVAWNRAAAVVLADYAKLRAPRAQHPAPRSSAILMCAPRSLIGKASRGSSWRRSAPTPPEPVRRRTSKHWSMSCVALSPEFAALWRDNDVSSYGEGSKHLRHPKAGLIALEYSSFCRRWPARSRHGGLQSGDAGGCRADQIAPHVANIRGGVTTTPFASSNSSSLWSASRGLTPSAQQSARTRCAWRRRCLAFDA